jgi:predicted amidohydrolase
MSAGVLKAATCQFAVSGSIKRNSRQICEFLHKAKKDRADIVHFPECALSGYGGADFETLDGFDWKLLREEAEKIMSLAAKLGLWVILGSTHRLTEPNKPHNSLYLIGPDGKIIDRYDKRFGTSGDLQHYTPGNRFVHFSANGVKCSLLICFDLRFPELYRHERAHLYYATDDAMPRSDELFLGEYGKFKRLPQPVSLVRNYPGR